MCGIIVIASKDFKNTNLASFRGPDSTVDQTIDNYDFRFNRLAIIDPTSQGNQPFVNDEFVLVCNGEIFNHRELRTKYKYEYKSHSDCEVLLPMLAKLPLDNLCNELDAEFVFVAYDIKNQRIMAARDPIGIRPLFYGYSHSGKIAFASEIKDLLTYCDKIYPFPPGHYFDGENFVEYSKPYEVSHYNNDNLETVAQTINQLLTEAVIKRLDADVPVGFLLSGGLDSSLVCAIAQKHSKEKIKTFAVGLDHNPIDLGYAKTMAEYLGTNHTEVIFNKRDVLNTLKEVIWHTETWDITTIRASIGMYIVCKYIRENSDVRVLLTGEVSDEMFGYKYTDFAPNAAEFQQESAKRIKELYMYDVLRADRCIAGNSLEARVPFADKFLVEYVMSINPELKLNTYKMGKYLLRKAFDNNSKLLPEDILWREKAAFSDAVGHSMVDYLIEHAQETYSDEEFTTKIANYTSNQPQSKESLLYREIFNEMFPNQEHVIKAYWLPNQEWPNCNVKDPSARVLPNYGNSGI